MNIISIDAWGNEEDGFDWNVWYKIGSISKEEFETLDTDEKILSWLHEAGYLASDSMAHYGVSDDEYNVVISNAETTEPLIAIEYGPEVY